MQWTFAPPLPDELLSAYLCRCAHGLGLSANAFAREVLGHPRLWKTDVDAAAVPWLSEAAARMGLSPEQVHALTLHPWSSRLAPGGMPPTASMCISRFSPRPGRATRHGVAFCADCLAESGTFMRASRLAFVTWCSRHTRMLHDACAACDAPVLVHRQRSSLLHCWQCGFRLTAGRPHAQPPSPGVLRLQADCLSYLSSPEVTAAQDTERLRGLTYLLRLVSRTRLRSAWPLSCMAASPESIDRLRMPARVQVLEVIAQLHQADFQPLFELLRTCAVSQRYVRRIAVAPSSLDPLIARLPPGRVRSALEEKRLFRCRLHRLQCQRPNGWRTAHARLVLGTRANVRRLAGLARSGRGAS